MSIGDGIAYVLPTAVLIAVWVWFIKKMPKVDPTIEAQKTNAELLALNREAVQLLREIKDSLRSMKSQ